MFTHIFIYRLKCIVRDRQMLFWTFLFPLVMATLFGMALGNVHQADTFSKIPIAVVNNDAYRNNPAFQTAIQSVSGKGSGSNDLFTVSLSSEENADEALKNGKIDGYVLLDNNGGARVIVKESGINQTILKEFMDDYLETESAVKTVFTQSPDAARHFKPADAGDGYLKTVTPTKAKPNDTLTYYYALIALACLYGGFWGVKEVTAVQADLSDQGARINLVPVHKMKIFGSALCAALLVQVLSVFLLVAYMGLVLKVDFGNQLFYILLACVAGSMTGVSMGAMIGTVIKKGQMLKTALLIVLTMTCSFLAGLMVAQIKYWVTRAFPPIAFLNPGNLIADSFYSLYYYNTHARYFLNIGVLCAFSAVFFLITYFIMRRQKYASL